MDDVPSTTLPGDVGGDAHALSHLIDMIGDKGFGAHLLSFLNQIAGAESLALLNFIDGRPVEVTAASIDGTDTAHRQISLYLRSEYWKRDPGLDVVQHMAPAAASRLAKMDVNGFPDSELRTRIYGRSMVRERILLCGGSSEITVALSILRSDRGGAFSGEQTQRIAAVAPILVSTMRRHSQSVLEMKDVALFLSSLPEIAACLSNAPEGLTRREVEVCARILYGISAVGIALDLRISEETVITYRKRAYQRLSIGTQHELLLWYVGRWSESRRLSEVNASALSEHCSRPTDASAPLEKARSTGRSAAIGQFAQH